MGGMKIEYDIAFKHALYPLLIPSAQFRLSTTNDSMKEQVHLLMTTTTHYERSLLKDIRECLAYSKHKWDNVPIFIQTVRLLNWDSRYIDGPSGFLKNIR